MAPNRFAIRVGRRYRLLLRLLFGVTDERAWVELAEDQLVARFGWYELRTPIDNISGWRSDGPWRWFMAIGVRRSIRFGDVTFSGTADGGVRLGFRDRVRWTIFDVPELYLGMDDPEGFGSALTALGVPEEAATD